MAKSHSITTIFLASFLSGLILVIALLGYLWFSASYFEMKREAEALREDFLDNQRDLLRNQVEQVVQGPLAPAAGSALAAPATAAASAAFCNSDDRM